MSGPLAFETFEPNDFQAELVTKVVIERISPLTVPSAVGVGKTCGIAYLCRILADVVPTGRVLVAMATERNLRRNLLPACRALFRGRARWVARDSTWIFDTGFTMECAHYRRAKGADEAENPIEGADVLLVIGDEMQMVPESFLKHAMARARQACVDELGMPFPAGVILMGRPSATGWHRRRVREVVAEMGGDPDAHVLEFKTTANAANLSAPYMANLKATLTPEEFRALTECAEMPPENGRAFPQFSVKAWPEGNIYEEFVFDPSRPTWLAMDLGQNTPHVLAIQEVEERLGRQRVTLDVVFAEAAPSKILTPELAAMITTGWPDGGRVLAFWPRGLRGEPTSLPLDGVVCDPAGHDGDRHTGLSDIALLRRSPTEGWMPGLGVPVRAPGSPEQRRTRTRALTLQSLFLAADGVRRLVLAPNMLRNDHNGRALYKALMNYGWDDIARAEERRKGYADKVGAVDALGYYAVERRRAPDDDEAEATDLDPAPSAPRWQRTVDRRR